MNSEKMIKECISLNVIRSLKYCLKYATINKISLTYCEKYGEIRGYASAFYFMGFENESETLWQILYCLANEHYDLAWYLADIFKEDYRKW